MTANPGKSRQTDRLPISLTFHTAPIANIIFNNLTGPGDPSLYSCWASHTSWLRRGTTAFATEVPYSTGGTLWTDPTPTITTNACDGIPRSTGQSSTWLTITHSGVTSTRFNITVLPRPTCTISRQSDCTNVYQAFASLTSSFISSISSAATARGTTVPGNLIYTFNSLAPPCTRDSDIRACPTAPAAGQKTVNCHLHAREGLLFYWPTKADLCNPASIVTPTAAPESPPKTAVFRGATVTSPTALLILKSVSMMEWSKMGGLYTYSTVTCGRTVDGQVTLHVPPKDLSTATWLPAEETLTWSSDQTQILSTFTPTPTPFNLADLDSVPLSNYANHNWECRVGRENCSTTIWEGLHRPVLYMPPQATELPGVPTNCRADGSISWSATYVPITAETLASPTNTRWGATPNPQGLTPTPVLDNWNPAVYEIW